MAGVAGLHVALDDVIIAIEGPEDLAIVAIAL